MPTFLLSALANTLLATEGWTHTLGLLCLLAIPLVSIEAVMRGFQTSSRLALDQFGRSLAWLFAPALAATPPYLFFTNINAALTVLSSSAASPAALCGLALFALTLFCAGHAAITSAIARTQKRSPKRETRPQMDAGDPSAPARGLPAAPITALEVENSPTALLILRIEALTNAVHGLAQQIESLREEAAAPETAAPDSRSEHESPQDAAIEALQDMGYHEGPWAEDNAPSSADTDQERYPPRSNDASFLSIWEQKP